MKIFLLLFALFPLYSGVTCKSGNDLQHNSPNKHDVQNNNFIPNLMDTNKLILKLELRYSETSKDCNSSTTNVYISEDKIQIEKVYNGFKAPDNETFSRNINAGDLKQILDFIEKHQLNINLKEVKSTSNLGIARFLNIEIFGLKSSQILIEGKTNIWGTDDYVKREWGKLYVKSRNNIENREYFYVAENFVRFLMQME
jgi:hypothetical protein